MTQSQYQSMPKYRDPFEEEFTPDAQQDLRQEDGSYKWVYAVDMHKDLFMLEITLIVLALCFLVILIPIMLVTMQSGFDAEMFGVVLLCFAVVVLISVGSWWLVSTMYGWLYIMLFSMDDKGIRMRQVADQAEKTKLIASLTALTGALTHNYGTMAAGISGASSTEACSTFRNVSSISGDRKRGRIVLRSFMFFNLIYVKDEYYDFVFQYIADHCPNATVSYK